MFLFKADGRNQKLNQPILQENGLIEGGGNFQETY